MKKIASVCTSIEYKEEWKKLLQFVLRLGIKRNEKNCFGLYFHKNFCDIGGDRFACIRKCFFPSFKPLGVNFCWQRSHSTDLQNSFYISGTPTNIYLFKVNNGNTRTISWNLFRLNNKDIGTLSTFICRLYCWLWTNFGHGSSVSIVSK